MGWTGILATEWKNGSIDRKAQMERVLEWWFKDGSHSIVKGSMVGTTYYAAIRTNATNEVWCFVALTSVNGNEFCYKDMDETMGPYSYDCPATILNLLSPTDNECANTWREKCRAKKSAESDNNRIPRNFDTITMRQETETSGGIKGDIWEIQKGYYGIVGKNTRTGRCWRIPLTYLRNKQTCTILDIVQ